MIERQEIHCHNCDQYVQFNLDTGLNGRHVLHCPVCRHEHCRYVKDGVISDRRWDTRNGDPTPTFMITNTTSSATATFIVMPTSNAGTTAGSPMVTTSANTGGHTHDWFLRDAWLQTTAGR